MRDFLFSSPSIDSLGYVSLPNGNRTILFTSCYRLRRIHSNETEELVRIGRVDMLSFIICISERTLKNLITPLLRHFTLFGQENEQNMTPY